MIAEAYLAPLGKRRYIDWMGKNIRPAGGKW